MSKSREYIDNEMSIIEEDFHKTFYTMLGLAKVFEQMLPKFTKTITATRDRQAIKYATQAKNALQQFNFIASQIDNHYKVEDKADKEAYKNMHADIAKIIGITLDQIRFERYDNFANLMIDFNQGNYTQVEEHLLDSIMDYQESGTLEGLGMIKMHAPNLTAEQIESFAKDLVKWSDMRNLSKQTS